MRVELVTCPLCLGLTMSLMLTRYGCLLVSTDTVPLLLKPGCYYHHASRHQQAMADTLIAMSHRGKIRTSFRTWWACAIIVLAFTPWLLFILWLFRVK
jgi:hypothetical protein